MSLISNYCNQTAILKKANGSNKFGERITSSSRIKARIEFDTKVIKTKSGKEEISCGLLFTTSKLHSDDTIEYEGESYTIIKLCPIYDLSGIVDHYEAYLQ